MDNYESIKLNKNFRFLYARGKSFVSPSVVVYLNKNKDGVQRLGITSGKKIGGAVQRNRARRLIRVAYRTLLPELEESYDMVIVARTHCVYSSSKEVTEHLRSCFSQAQIIKDENSN